MVVFVLQVREAFRGRPSVLLWFAVFAGLVWLVWAIKVVLSRRYRPWTEPHETTVSVVIPVVDEPVDLFTEVLARIVAQHPDEVIVAINGPRNEPLERVCDAVGVDWVWLTVAGKRNAVAEGIRRATGDVVVLVDSDTLWAPGMLAELVKPFADPSVGGVTTNQRILDARRSFLTRWADWMESSRILYSLPAQSVLGHVGCLPGRTIAFRRPILVRALPDFLSARFLGAFIEVSDDRTLTNLTLKQGWRTVYQSTAAVYTDCPTSLRKMAKQQLRWARGSQYNTMRMLPWMVAHTPLLAFFFVADIAVPFLFLGTVAGWVWHASTHSGVNLLEPAVRDWGTSGWVFVAAAIVVGATLSIWLRQWRHLQTTPGDLLWMPVFVLWSSLFLMPIRFAGFVVAAKRSGWATRAGAHQHTDGRWNPWALIPAVAAGLILFGEVYAVARA